MGGGGAFLARRFKGQGRLCQGRGRWGAWRAGQGARAALDPATSGPHSTALPTRSAHRYCKPSASPGRDPLSQPALWTIGAHSWVNLTLDITSDKEEIVENGSFAFQPDCEWLSIPVSYRILKGELILVPPRVDFKPGFPGLGSRQARYRFTLNPNPYRAGLATGTRSLP